MKKRDSIELKRKALYVAVASVFTITPGWANPTNPSVAHGNATFNTAGSTLTVTNTPSAIINWASFGIGVGEAVRFVQQSAASTVLNRVTGINPSQILGTLQSNGRVFLINPQGVAFGKGAVIDTAGFVASTLNMKDADFVAGRMRFNADTATPGSISNAGEIKTPTGGFVWLIAPNVENTGIINTPSGEAVLAAGNSVELVDSNDPNLRVKVSATSQDVNLSQMMLQNGGNVFAVLNSGKVSANTAVVGKNGAIYFKSAGDIRTTAASVVEARGDKRKDGGHIQAFADGSGIYQGVFDASGRNGGFIETSGHTLDVSGLTVTATALSINGHGGTWLLDPFNYLLDGTQATAIASSLNSGTSVVIDTGDAPGPGNTGNGNGDIKVTGSIDVNSNGTAVDLTFTADGKFELDAPIFNNEPGARALSVTIVSDRDHALYGGDGGIRLFDMIDVKGNVSLTSWSGNITIIPDFYNGSYAAGIISNGSATTITAHAYGGLGGQLIMNNCPDGCGQNVSAEIMSHGNQTITVDGGIDMYAGTGAYAPVIIRQFGSGTQTINSGGDIVLRGSSGSSSGNGYGFAYIETGTGANDIDPNLPGGNQFIYFTQPGKTLALYGGSGGTNNFAGITSRGTSQFVGGDVAANNPHLVFYGGSSNFSDAGINLHVHGAASGTLTVNAASIDMYGGTATDTTAYIGGEASSTININVNVTDGSNWGTLYMYGGSDLAAIGSDKANANITINAGDIQLYGSLAMVGVIGCHGDKTCATGAPNDATVTMTAYGSSGISVYGGGFGSGGIGSERGSSTVTLNSLYDNGDGGYGGITLNGIRIGSLNGNSAANVTMNAVGDIDMIHALVGHDGYGSATVNMTSTYGNIYLEPAAIGSWRGNATVNLTASYGSILVDGSQGSYIGSTFGGFDKSSGVVNVTLHAKNTIDLNSYGGSGVYVGGNAASTINMTADTGSINFYGANVGSYGGHATINLTATVGPISIEQSQVGGYYATSGTTADITLVAGNSVSVSYAGIGANGTANVSLTANRGDITIDSSLVGSQYGSANVTLAAHGGDVGYGGISLTNSGVGTLHGSSGTTVTLSSNDGYAGNEISMDSASRVRANTVNAEAYGGMTLYIEAANPTGVTVNLPHGLGTYSNNSIYGYGGSMAVISAAPLIVGGEGGSYAYTLDLDITNAPSGSSLTLMAPQMTLYGGAAGLNNPNGLVQLLGSPGVTSDVTLNNMNLYGPDIAATDIRIAATNVTLNYTQLSVSGDVSVFGQNITLNDSELVGSFVGLNYDPLVLSSITGIGDITDLYKYYSFIKSSTVTINSTAGSGRSSGIFGYYGAGVMAGTLNLDGAEGGLSAFISGGQYVDIITAGKATLKAEAGSAIISAGKEIYMSTGGILTLESGAFNGFTGTYVGSAAVTASIPATIYLDFPLLSSNGYIVDGVTNAIVSSLDQYTGFFSGYSLSGPLPAVLDSTMFVRYGGIPQEVITIIGRSDDRYECS